MPQCQPGLRPRAPARSRLVERLTWVVLGGAIAGARAFVLRPAATIEEPRQRVTFEISPRPERAFLGRRLDAAAPRMVTGTESPNDAANQSVF